MQIQVKNCSVAQQRERPFIRERPYLDRGMLEDGGNFVAGKAELIWLMFLEIYDPAFSNQLSQNRPYFLELR